MTKFDSFGCIGNCCCCLHCGCSATAANCCCVSEVEHVEYDIYNDDDDINDFNGQTCCCEECQCKPCKNDDCSWHNHSHHQPSHNPLHNQCQYHQYCKPISYADCSSSRSAEAECLNSGQQSVIVHRTPCGPSTTAIPVSSIWSQITLLNVNTNSTSAKSVEKSPQSSESPSLSNSSFNHSSISPPLRSSIVESTKKMCQTQLPTLRLKSSQLKLRNSRISTSLFPVSSLVILSLLVSPSFSLPDSHDAWRHSSSLSSPLSPTSSSSHSLSPPSSFVHSNIIHKKSKSNHASFAPSSTLSLNRHSQLPSSSSLSLSSSNFAAKSHHRNPGSVASHLSRTNFNPYRNSQLLSIPFSSQLPQLMAYQQHHQHQQLQHQLQHQHNHHHQLQQLLSPPAPVPMSHSIVSSQLSGSSPLSPTSISLSSNQNTHNGINSDNSANNGNNNHIHLESNNFPPRNHGVSNSIRIKGSKWWDIANHPASVSASLEQTVQMGDSRQSNSIMPTATNSLANNINLPLRKKQRRLVRDNPGVLTAISKAMRLAIHECQNQFKERRWNCPVNDWKKGKNLFGKITQRGCRETAFVYALTSAAVAHSIARACSEGQIETCTCEPRNNRKPSGQVDWEWGGCSDNIKFGYKFAKSFVDAAERGRDQRFVMNLHNNEAGRLHVSNEMRRECKCHGMSGSCTVKTCWMRLPSFRDIGNNLKDRFDGASRVLVSNDFRGISRKMYKKVQLKPYETGYKSPTMKDLIYFEESPDYCVPNPKYSVSGTQGRVCNASSIGVEGCGLLCCGRGYVTEEIEEFERCNCTFHWCCEVRCRICKNKKKIHRCL